MSNDRGRSRRSLLASFGSIGLFSGLAGISSGAKSKRTGEHIAEGSGSMELKPKTALSEPELDAELEALEDEYGAAEAAKMAPPHKKIERKEGSGEDPQLLSARPDQIDTDNFKQIHTWEENDTVYADQTGAYLGKFKQMATVYEGSQTTDYGENVYAIWHMMRAEDDSSWLSVKTQELKNGIDLPYGYTLHSYDPAETKDHGEGTEIGIDVERGPMSISDSFTMGDGEVFPSYSTSTGSGGEFAVEFDGCNKGRTLINGLSLVTSHRDFSRYSIDWNWDYRMTTTTYCVNSV